MIADTSELQRILGEEAARTLVQVAGGLALRIPLKAPLDSPLCDLPETAQSALIAWAGGDVIYIPKCDAARRAQRNAEIVALYDSGLSVKEIALRYRMSERWVYEILGRPVEERQGSLF